MNQAEQLLEAIRGVQSLGDPLSALDELIAARGQELRVLRAIRDAMPPPRRDGQAAGPQAPPESKPDPEPAGKDDPGAEEPFSLPPEPPPKKVAADVLETVAQTIQLGGPAKSVEALAKRARLQAWQVYAAVKHHWFVKESDGYHLTAEAYSEFLKKDG